MIRAGSRVYHVGIDDYGTVRDVRDGYAVIKFDRYMIARCESVHELRLAHQSERGYLRLVRPSFSAAVLADYLCDVQPDGAA